MEEEEASASEEEEEEEADALEEEGEVFEEEEEEEDGALEEDGGGAGVLCPQHGPPHRIAQVSAGIEAVAPQRSQNKNKTIKLGVDLCSTPVGEW